MLVTLLTGIAGLYGIHQGPPVPRRTFRKKASRAKPISAINSFPLAQESGYNGIDEVLYRAATAEGGCRA
jgi:hypothetical protein